MIIVCSNIIISYYIGGNIIPTAPDYYSVIAKAVRKSFNIQKTFKLIFHNSLHTHTPTYKTSKFGYKYNILFRQKYIQ